MALPRHLGAIGPLASNAHIWHSCTVADFANLLISIAGGLATLLLFFFAVHNRNVGDLTLRWKLALYALLLLFSSIAALFAYRATHTNALTPGPVWSDVPFDERVTFRGSYVLGRREETYFVVMPPPQALVQLRDAVLDVTTMELDATVDSTQPMIRFALDSHVLFADEDSTLRLHRSLDGWNSLQSIAADADAFKGAHLKSYVSAGAEHRDERVVLWRFTTSSNAPTDRVARFDLANIGGSRGMLFCQLLLWTGWRTPPTFDIVVRDPTLRVIGVIHKRGPR
jgi:hypothetical protein